MNIMLKRRLLGGVSVAGILIIGLSVGWSATTAYFDRTPFLAAGANLPGTKQQIRFADYHDGNLFTTTQFGPQRAVVTIAGVGFTGRYLTLGQVGLWNYDGLEPMTISFSSGARAVGAYFSSDMGGLSSNFTATIMIDSGEQFVFKASGAPRSTFFGLVSTTGITNLTFSDGAQFFGLREEQIGTIYMVLNSIPIPSLKILVQPEFQNVGLSWPATSPGFIVEENMGPSPGSWLGVARGELASEGTNWFVRLAQSNRPKFYRLVLGKDQWQ